MSFRKVGALLVFGILLVSSGSAQAQSATPQIWFNLTNYNMPDGVDGPQGWNKLCADPNAPWPDFMNRVQVVAAAGIMQVPDDVLAKVFVKLKQKLKQQGLIEKIGIIYDGTVKDTTDLMWVEDAQRHVLLMEDQYHLKPDDKIFQSWMPQPTHAFPESQPDTLTSLVDWYFRKSP